MSKPDITILLATYNRANYLNFCLASLCNQNYDGWWEIVVADDGSTDHTPQIVKKAEKLLGKNRIRHHWHPHDRFRKAFTLNESFREGVKGDLLVFMDSDCIASENLLSTYTRYLSRGDFFLGGVYGLNKSFSQKVLQTNSDKNLDKILTQAGKKWNQKTGQSRKVFKRYIKSRLYCALNIKKPKIWGANFAVKRKVFEEINGFDENYEGYGQEDSDIRDRLQNGRYRPVCVHIFAKAFHLWHPVNHQSRQEAYNGKNNRPYYNREEVPVVCHNGLRNLQGIH